ncbi:granulocyte colony-stimulating factor-like [Mugil cephalus]|uniref:granulocyte colony-stimulating factor-like n=1 Tax=Mugil cephalus TaxID=48193 RepID=UPI001FB7EE13|nr:granulocyte colony-stimulating factor-like [Mugil cephalus]
MDAPIVIAILHCFLFASLVRSAPVSSLTNCPPAFREAAEQAKTLVEKILQDIPAVHRATVNSESMNPSSPTTNLQVMATSMGIPASPVLKPLSERFTLDLCVSRMLEGSQLYHGLLGDLSKKLSGLEDLRVDLRDLQTHISKMKDAAQLGGDGSEQNPSLNLQSSFDVQVAAHVTLTQLRSFCHDLVRSLRAIANSSRP